MRIIRWVRDGALALLLCGVASAVGLAAADPAYAHNELRSANPAEGATVQAAPAEVSLTFSQTSNLQFVRIAVTDAAGVNLVDGGPAANGTTLVQKVRAPTAAGKIVIAYRVVSNDGHPVQGNITFTAAGAAVATPSAAPSSAPAAGPATTGVPAAATSTAAAAPDGGGSSWLVPLGIGVAVAIAAVTVIALIRARRRAADGP